LVTLKNLCIPRIFLVAGDFSKQRSPNILPGFEGIINEGEEPLSEGGGLKEEWCLD
jgi:hypothetical protein